MTAFRRSVEQHPSVTSLPAPVHVVRGRKGALAFFQAGGEMTAHSPRPHYAGSPAPDPACTFLDGVPCYAEGGTGRGVRGTDEEVFAQMESEYDTWFPERGA